MTENSASDEQPESADASNDNEGRGRRSRKKRHLQRSREEALTVTAGLSLAAELLTNQLQWVIAAAPGVAQRKRPLARDLARGFSRAVREVDTAYRELAEAQASLELARDTDAEVQALQARIAAEQRFRDAFGQLALQPLVEAED